ncbi:MAG: fumarylacetoacetate hydrolase family protein [Candidatus Delongbacteria bacterium]|jgi:2-keto-4-pentenoate hydratase/2-oxohepta-3-ene-1,7-dioic acid hydratase in catechol pathway|nr:fumarylacetoacetate hydrolase family protein [Candidatus Delongbacteria bacterium]
MKIIFIGKNYAEHNREMHSEAEKQPVFFLKADSCLHKGHNPFFIPDFSDEVHYEVEIVLRIGKLGRSIQGKFAPRYYDAISVGIDFTARDLQHECKIKGLPWEISKSFDQSAWVGKWIDPAQLKTHENLNFWLKKNDKTVQSGYTHDMIFSPDNIIAFVSQFMTLKTGDLIFTGTPQGVGPVNTNDFITAGIGNETLLHCEIK